MVEYYRKIQANSAFPGWNEYPSISKSGSLIGMKRLYRWDLRKVIQVGSYYYHLQGHPAMEERIKRKERGEY